MISVKRNFIFNLLLVGSNIVFPILIFPLIARVIGPEGIGKVQFAVQFSRYFALTASLGIPIYGVREVAKVKDNAEALSKLVKELIGLNLITSFVCSLIYIGVMYFSSTIWAQWEFFAVAGLQILFGSLAIDWLFMGLEEFKIITFRSVFVRLLTLVLMLFLVNTKGDEFYYLMLIIGGTLLGHLLNVFYMLGRLKWHAGEINLTKHLRPILVIFLINVCITMYTVFDSAWIGFLGTITSVGLYTAAIKFTKIGIPIVTALGTVLLPKSARSFATEIAHPSHLPMAFNFIVDLAVPMGFGLFLLAPQLVFLFSGSEFNQAVTAMKWFSILPFLIGLSNLFCMQILSASGNDNELLKSVAIGMLINVCLNILFIPFYGHNGAAVSLVVTELAVTLLTYFYANRRFAIPFHLERVLKSAVVSLAFLPIVYGINQLNLSIYFTLCLNTVLCFAVYWGLQWVVFKNHFVELGYQTFKSKLYSDV